MIQIVTDSSAYLPADLVQQHNIHVIPLKVLFGDKTYREGVDLSQQEFYRMLAEAKTLPTTSQPSAGEFFDLYSELSKDGHEIISIHISSKLSGTISSAQSAKEMLPEARITIVDSASTAMGLGLMVLTAAKAVAEGKITAEIVATVEKMIPAMNVVFVVDTLEYLQKGGRIGGAAALVGTLLKIKPILCLKDGRVEPLDKVRSKRKALVRLLDVIEERVGPGTPIRAAVLHAEALDEAKELEQKVRARFNCTEYYFTELGPVLGTHTGPGVLGLVAVPQMISQGL
ncbi:MAG TPA: DegV family protein [Anaerolineae bacterium]|nr:DegV family protein [Anaerolineae bacterium]